jgi:hypothetical protein
LIFLFLLDDIELMIAQNVVGFDNSPRKLIIP